MTRCGVVVQGRAAHVSRYDPFMRWGVLLVVCSGCSALYPFDEFRFDLAADVADGGLVERDAVVTTVDRGLVADGAVDLVVPDSNAPEVVDGGLVERDVTEDRAPVGPEVTALERGGRRVCAVRSGQVWCWGGGASRPARLPLDGSSAVALQASIGPVFSVRAGALWSWDPSEGATLLRAVAGRLPEGVTGVAFLGSPLTVDRAGAVAWWMGSGSEWVITPVTLPPVRELASGEAGTYAVGVTGGLWSLRGITREVTELGGVARVAVGRSAACAQTMAGDVACAPPSGPFGPATAALRGSVVLGVRAMEPCGVVGDALVCASSGPQVTGLRGARLLVMGDDFGCAALAGGVVVCWGANASGELGDGTTAPHADARPVVW